MLKKKIKIMLLKHLDEATELHECLEVIELASHELEYYDLLEVINKATTKATQIRAYQLYSEDEGCW